MAWVVAICSVLFDLDVGQRIDSIYPDHALTDDEANDVAFHSFPVRLVPAGFCIDSPLLSCT